jgi:hypothetical protein
MEALGKVLKMPVMDPVPEEELTLTKGELERFLHLPSMEVLVSRLERAQAHAKEFRDGTRIGYLNQGKHEIEQAQRDIDQGLLRDAVQSDRPEGCWCFGLGGKDEKYDYAGASHFAAYCSCADGQRVEKEHEKAQRIADNAREQKRLHKGWEAAEWPTRFRNYRLRTSPLVQSRPDLIKLLTYPQAPNEIDEERSASDEEWTAWRDAETAWLRSWFLFGPYGTGKTGLAVGYAGEYLKCYAETLNNWTPMLFRAMPDVFSELRDTYNGKGSSEQEVIKKFTEVPLLILDDLGAEHGVVGGSAVPDHRQAARRGTNHGIHQ